MSKTRITNAEQHEKTRQALLATARAHFTRYGYAGTSTQQLVEEAQVTRGALYYHFKNKKDLFHAVIVDLQEEMCLRYQDVLAQSEDPWKKLINGVVYFLNMCDEPTIRQIFLIDGPAVLGIAEWRELDNKYGVTFLRAIIHDCIEAKYFCPPNEEALVQIIDGMIVGAARAITYSPTPEETKKQVIPTFIDFLDKQKKRCDI